MGKPPGPDTLMRVLVLTRYDRLGASSRVRFLQYLPYLKARGFSIQVAPLLDDDYVRGLYGGRRKHYADILRAYRERIRLLRQSRSRFDLVWIEKELFPWLPAWGERWLNRLGVPYVVDYDDATFHQYDRHRRGGVRRLLGGKIDEVMRRAALVVVGSDYLAERARQAGAGRVEYLPTVIDLDRYTATPKSENDLFTIGWIGVPVTAPFLQIVGPALAVVCRGGAARVVLVGAGAGKPDGVPGQVRPWSEETEVSEVQSFDAGIMPLPDAPFERGKCGYKLIQYMACGRPVVASPVGINGKIVEEGVNGFLAAGPEDWTRALCALRDNPALRERMGREARKKVEREYCLQVTAPRLLRLLQSVPAR